MVEFIRRNVAKVLGDIAFAAESVGRSPLEVRLVGVSKFHPLEAMQAAETTGICAFGESRVQEAWQKWQGWKGERRLPWHMIGHLQRNKVVRAMGIFDCFHSVDSLRLAWEMELQASKLSKKPSVFFEVNMSGEGAKYGMTPEEVLPTAEEFLGTCPSLSLDGLMTMAPYGAGERETRKIFASLYVLREKLRSRLSLTLPELSMGMSGDYVWAVLEGSTMVRVGTKIFGNRE